MVRGLHFTFGSGDQPPRTAEDNLNISLKDITVTQRDGRVTQLDQVYIRGPMVRFFIVPDMLANAPM
jgi:small nuclear ribonucleoprotein D3